MFMWFLNQFHKLNKVSHINYSISLVSFFWFYSIINSLSLRIFFFINSIAPRTSLLLCEFINRVVFTSTFEHASITYFIFIVFALILYYSLISFIFFIKQSLNFIHQNRPLVEMLYQNNPNKYCNPSHSVIFTFSTTYDCCHNTIVTNIQIRSSKVRLLPILCHSLTEF